MGKSKKNNNRIKRGGKNTVNQQKSKGGSYQSVDAGDDEKPKFGNRNNNNNKKEKKKKKKKTTSSSSSKNTGGGDDQLRKDLNSEGFEIVEMNADGNCMFRSLSDQVFGDYGSNHVVVRNSICDYMVANKDDFQLFLVFGDDDDENEEETKEEEDTDAKNFEHYIATMRADGEWGGNLELVAASRLFQRRIQIYPTSTVGITAYTIEWCSSSDTISATTTTNNNNNNSSKSNTYDKKYKSSSVSKITTAQTQPTYETTSARVIPDDNIIVSYHDNYHYNSVRNKRHPPITKNKSTSSLEVTIPKIIVRRQQKHKCEENYDGDEETITDNNDDDNDNNKDDSVITGCFTEMLSLATITATTTTTQTIADDDGSDSKTSRMDDDKTNNNTYNNATQRMATDGTNKFKKNKEKCTVSLWKRNTISEMLYDGKI